MFSFLTGRLLFSLLNGATSRLTNLEKLSLNFSNSSFVMCQSSPSLTIFVLLWFIIISLVFFYLSKVTFSGLLQFKDNFERDQNRGLPRCENL